MSTIKFKRGLKSNLPVSASVGEPIFTSDTNEFFIGTGTGLTQFTGQQGPQGDAGPQGATGQGFKIVKSYSSVANLTSDTTPSGIVVGEFAIVNTGNTADVDNGKLYVWDGSVYTFVNDISGLDGLVGPQGDIGPQGPQGDIGPQGPAGDLSVLTASNGVTRNVNNFELNSSVAGSGLSFDAGVISIDTVDGGTF